MILPNEILISILKELDKFGNLYSCLLVSHNLYYLTLPILYKAPLITSAKSLRIFINTITKKNCAINSFPFNCYIKELKPPSNYVEEVNLKYIPHRWLDVKTDHLLSILNACPNIHTLNLNTCKCLKDKTIRSIVKLYGLQFKALDISFCNSITDETIIDLAEHCPNLEELDLTGCELVTEKSISQIIKKCKRLKFLDITGCEETIGLNISKVGLNVFGIQYYP
ncbi:RNI-like protein [Piromyces finnis]|uniref:RNI-like protein n=1 Tax=Piromyces finnis TaxID=1754191 RepID=A0A1Y1V6L1_9FUNG|nr:RNI-like protein [Piromyces finnis]|eukprot:ORX47312.1 RNI-like protein [Piromyces finnis]